MIDCWRDSNAAEKREERSGVPKRVVVIHISALLCPTPINVATDDGDERTNAGSRVDGGGLGHDNVAEGGCSLFPVSPQIAPAIARQWLNKMASNLSDTVSNFIWAHNICPAAGQETGME